MEPGEGDAESTVSKDVLGLRCALSVKVSVVL